MTISVIIATHNAAGTIRRVLEAVRLQLAPRDQLLVVDDGSEDGTREAVALLSTSSPVQLLPLAPVRRGAAAARNAGLRAATSDLVLFLGDDTVPDRQLVNRHRAVHLVHPEEVVGCLGQVTWDPLLPPSPFMIWLEHGGPQNAYGEIAGQRWVDPRRYFYAANLSVKRTFVERAGGFDDERFSTYGFEDTDLGLRLARRGLRLCYEPTARVWHAHPHTLTSFLTRQRAAGRNFVLLAARYPRDISLPPGARGWGRLLRALVFPFPVRLLLGACASVASRRWILSGMFSRVTGWAFTDSVQESLRNRRSYVENIGQTDRGYPEGNLGNYSASLSQKETSQPVSIDVVNTAVPHRIHKVVHKE